MRGGIDGFPLAAGNPRCEDVLNLQNIHKYKGADLEKLTVEKLAEDLTSAQQPSNDAREGKPIQMEKEDVIAPTAEEEFTMQVCDSTGPEDDQTFTSTIDGIGQATLVTSTALIPAPLFSLAGNPPY